MEKIKGFTLVELVVTIAIVIALTAVSVPIYSVNKTKVKLSEGYALLATIRSGQERYYAEYGNFLGDTDSDCGYKGFAVEEKVLGINARTNKYFTRFSVNAWDLRYNKSGTKFFAAIINSKDQSLTMVYDLDSGVTIR